MVQRYNFSTLTNLGGVATPQNGSDAVTKDYVDGRGGSAVENIDLSSFIASNNRILYNPDVTIPLQTVSAQATDSTFVTWNLNTQILNFVLNTQILGVTTDGKIVIGTYVLTAGVYQINPAYVDRSSGFVANQSYSFTFRQLLGSASAPIFGADLTPAFVGTVVSGRQNFISSTDSANSVGITANVNAIPIVIGGEDYYDVYFNVPRASVATVADNEIATLIGSLQTRTQLTTGSTPLIAAINQGGTNLIINFTAPTTVVTLNALLTNAFISNSQTSNSPSSLQVSSVTANATQAQINFVASVSAANVSAIFSTSSAIWYATNQNVTFVFNANVLTAIDAEIAARAVTSLTASGSTIRGDVALAAGTNISITPSGQTLTIAATGSGGGVSQIVAGTNVTISPATGTGIVTVNATGGSTGGWSVGGNTFIDTETKVLGPTTANPLSIVSNNLEGIRLDLGFGQTTTNISYSGGTPGGQLQGYWRMGNLQFVGFNSGVNPIWTAQLGSNTFTQANGLSVPTSLSGIIAGVQGLAGSNQLLVSLNGGGLGVQQGIMVINNTLTNPVIQRYSVQFGTDAPEAIDIDLNPTGNRLAACWGTQHIGWTAWNATTTSLTFSLASTSANFITSVQWLDDNNIIGFDSGGDVYKVNVNFTVTTLGQIPGIQQPFESTLYGSTMYVADYNGLNQITNTSAASWTATQVESWAFNTFVWATEDQYAPIPTFFLGNITNNNSYTTITGSAEVVIGRTTSGSTKLQAPLTYIGDGGSNFGSLAAGNAPTPTSFTQGALGQSLLSSGTKTYWGFQPVTIVTLPYGTFTPGPRTMGLTMQLNNLNLTISDNSISGFAAGALYEIFISAGSQLSASGNANEYYSCSTNNGIVTAPAYGTGASVAIIHTSTQPVGDAIQGTGIGHLNTGATLYVYQYSSASGTFGGNNFIKITRIN